MASLSLSSPAFRDAGPIPRQYGYTRDNVNPPLRMAGIPEGTESLVLIMDDPDAVEPAGKVWDHWVVWNIPATLREIPEDWDVKEGVQGTTDYGEQGYGGPNPPDGKHTYHFKLYALDTRLDLPASSTKEDVEEAIRGHVLDEAELTGTYAP